MVLRYLQEELTGDASFAIGIVGDAGVRGVALQPRLFVGMVLILIFAEVLGGYIEDLTLYWFDADSFDSPLWYDHRSAFGGSVQAEGRDLWCYLRVIEVAI